MKPHLPVKNGKNEERGNASTDSPRNPELQRSPFGCETSVGMRDQKGRTLVDKHTHTHTAERVSEGESQMLGDLFSHCVY